MNEQTKKEQCMAEVFRNLSPEAQEKMLCMGEAIRLMEMPKAENKTA